MPLKKLGRTDPIPGSGTLFALRVIGIVFLIRWVHSMTNLGLADLLQAMAGSAWACINAVFIFLLVVLPGAKPRAERPSHPMPQWLRQAIRGLGSLGLLFAVWLVCMFFYRSGLVYALSTVRAANGWPLVAPALFALAVWLCRPRPLWPTNPVARRFAIGRYTVMLDAASQTAMVWAENRKLGHYAVRELSVLGSPHFWPARTSFPKAPGNMPLLPASPMRSVALLWRSPAAAGHNRHLVFLVSTWHAADKFAAQALDAALRRIDAERLDMSVPLDAAAESATISAGPPV